MWGLSNRDSVDRASRVDTTREAVGLSLPTQGEAAALPEGCS